MKSYCYFNLHFPEDILCEASFHTCICHFYIFIGWSICQVFGSFFKWGCLFSYCWILRHLCIFWIIVLYQMCLLQIFSPGCSQENALVIANTLFQQHKRRLYMDITTRSTPKSDWWYSLQPKMEKLYTVNTNKTRSWPWLRSWNAKLKKVGKTTRQFRYDLNQIPYNYTVEVRNRFKGLDLIDRVPDELWNEVPDIVQETGIKTIPMEKKCKKSKMGV